MLKLKSSIITKRVLKNDTKQIKLFETGSKWLRADFHLHTRADKEFIYTKDENDFISDYIQGLKKADIRLGVITNHNKFNLGEFKALRKAAHKEEICLLPGVELSVNEGSSGVHVLVVFNPDEWIKSDSDLIDPFISSMFPGKTKFEYENENANSDKNLIDTIEELNKRNLDYFIVFAHVEENKGLWKEVKGAKLNPFFTEERYALLKEKCLGFQKVRTHDVAERPCRLKIQGWLGNWYPAEIEGSDCKKIEDIGKGKTTYLKLGSFNFEAVKHALLNYKSRVRDSIPEVKHSYIQKINFTEGVGSLSSQIINFSAALNTLIGIRGSGKSSLIEVLRYALDLPAGDSDKKYKNDLIERALGSSGKLILNLIDCHNQEYEIHKIKDQSSDIYLNGTKISGISIKDTIIRNPIYFGQKDLTGLSSENTLIEKFLEKELRDIRLKINQKSDEVKAYLDKLSKRSKAEEAYNEQLSIITNTTHRLEPYKKYNLEDKLNESLELDKDLDYIEKSKSVTEDFINKFNEFLNTYAGILENFPKRESKQNKDLISESINKNQEFKEILGSLKIYLEKAEKLKEDFMNLSNTLRARKESAKEPFADRERNLALEIENSSIKNISIDDFKKFTDELRKAQGIADELSKVLNDEKKLSEAFENSLDELENLWLEEYNLAKTKLKELCEDTKSISIECEFQNNKEAFLSFIKQIFSGSGKQPSTYKRISDEFKNFIEMYRTLKNNFEDKKSVFGSNPEVFRELFNEKIKELITYQTPNKYFINYHGKNLLHHSLGQRASALIIFILTRGGHDLIMIDQPEDDLDNQTIYEDVIKLIREIKPQVQFILATHNPNIPVLADAELVQVCSFINEKIEVSSGSIDEPDIQKQIINIMEGGKEAFERRKEIYKKWNP
jgi:predicted ATPase